MLCRCVIFIVSVVLKWCSNRYPYNSVCSVGERDLHNTRHKEEETPINTLMERQKDKMKKRPTDKEVNGYIKERQ